MRNFGFILLTFLVSAHAMASELASFLGESFISRESWGAQIRNYDALLAGNDISIDEQKELAILHHTVTGYAQADLQTALIPFHQEFALVKAIEHFHLAEKKWADIGYHFIISQSGRIYEARPLRFVGAHTFGFNKKSVGIAFLGCYDDNASDMLAGQEVRLPVQAVTIEMQEAAARLLAALAKLYQLPLSEESIEARSVLELKKKGATNFPYSPGNRIITAMPNIIARAKEMAAL